MQLQGRVRGIAKFGAFVDVGVGRDGLVHISELRGGHVQQVEDVVRVGETVTVWVKEVDTRRKRISLTMIPPQAETPRKKLSELEVGSVVEGAVRNVVKFGAFVDIGAEAEGLIHVSEMAGGEVVAGDRVRVRIKEVDAARGRISLSLKDVPAAEAAEDEEPASPSAIAEALRQAREGKKKQGKRGEGSEDEARRREQEDLIERTLRHLRRQSGEEEE